MATQAEMIDQIRAGVPEDIRRRAVTAFNASLCYDRQLASDFPDAVTLWDPIEFEESQLPGDARARRERMSDAASDALNILNAEMRRSAERQQLDTMTDSAYIPLAYRAYQQELEQVRETPQCGHTSLPRPNRVVSAETETPAV